jgi:hypothetical protein
MGSIKQKRNNTQALAVEQFEHGAILDIAIEQIQNNEWNPNEMTAAAFNLLSENVDDVGFLDPPLIVPIIGQKTDDGRQMFRIVDGEHRVEQQRLSDAKLIRCVIADPEKFDEITQKKQTMRMNSIRGKVNPKKLAKLVTDLIEGGVPYADMAHELGFADPDEFQSILSAARDSLPTDDMKKEFDKVKDEIKTVDDLSLVLNRLFTKFGDTLPHNFMVLDFGGREHIWVRMKRGEHKKIIDKARECVAGGVTFDSVLSQILLTMDLPRFIDKFKDKLEAPTAVDRSDIDESFEDGSEE